MDLNSPISILVPFVQALIGAGFLCAAQSLARYIKVKPLRIVLSWPLFGLAYLFLSSALFEYIWNMVGPIVRLFA